MIGIIKNHHHCFITVFNATMIVSIQLHCIFIFILFLNSFFLVRCVQISKDLKFNNILRRRQSNETQWKASINDPHRSTVNFVSLISNQNELPVQFEIFRPTLEMAIADVRKKYPHIQFDLATVYDDHECQDNVLGALAAEKFYTSQVSAFIGPICSLALDPLSRMASYWNVPVFTPGGISFEFSNKKTFSTLTRMAFSLGINFNFNLIIPKKN